MDQIFLVTVQNESETGATVLRATKANSGAGIPAIANEIASRKEYRTKYGAQKILQTATDIQKNIVIPGG